MSTKKTTPVTETEKEELEVKEPAKSAEPAGTMDARDARIAELEAQLAAAQRQSASYRAGNDFDVVKRAAEECIASGTNEWDVKVSVRVPERRDTTDKSYWLCVNGRSVQLPANNQYQEMRLPFADALMRLLQAEKYAQHFADNAIQVYDPITNPRPGDGMNRGN